VEEKLRECRGVSSDGSRSNYTRKRVRVARMGAVPVRKSRFVALEGTAAKLSSCCRNLTRLLVRSAYVNMSIGNCDESTMTERNVGPTVAGVWRCTTDPSSLPG
jgi:hypothetical protein